MGDRPLATPERYHNSDRRHAGAFATCRRCWRARSVCRRKIRFNTYVHADIAVDNFNEAHNYVRPLTRYRCRWCMAWHTTTAKNRYQMQRAERQRRKWLQRVAATGEI